MIAPLFQLLIIAGEAIGEVFGRKPKPSKADRVWFAIFYTALLVTGVAIVIWTIYWLYFSR